MRVLGLDYGDARVGLAYTDILGITVQPYKTIYTKGSDRLILNELEKIIKEKEVSKIVVGMPYHTDGTIGERGEKTKKFIHKLKCRFNTIEIDSFDERYTSLEADDMMRFLNVKPKDRKEIRDTLAAVYILEGYMKQKENNNANKNI